MAETGNKHLRELESLLARQMDGRLSDDELRRIGEILRGDAEARRFYIRHCQMHAMLKEEQATMALLAAEEPPANVVSLPSGERGMPGEAVAAKASRAPLAIAACLLGALLIGGLVMIDRERDAGIETGAFVAETENVAETAPADPPHADPAAPPTPEEEYREKLLAMSDGGSQNRPPTPFSSDAGAAPARGKVDFNRDIRPVLSDNCFHCHGPSESDRKADLRLDTADGIAADLGGYAAVVAGDPDASELVARILIDDPDEMMPPPKSHKKLSAEQKELLKRWIAEGAEWREHWSFEPIARPEPPPVADESGIRNPIDRFIRARLDEERLRPAPPADRHTLIRRATFDLTGLPPTPEEVQDFVRDESAEAYENLVDRLLASARYGEHRARFWLDAARYGDTHGLHLDNYREIWAYRDWVINAYNENMPFDQFTVEQLAGDLMPEPTVEQRIATGFNRCNVTTSEGGSIKEEYAARYAVDRVATTSTVWMGLTTECAVCHDHKYDPISMKEFYRLFAYFNNTTQDPMDGNIEDTPPVIRLYESPEDETAEKEIQKRVKNLDARLKKLRGDAEPAFEVWLAGLSRTTAKKEKRLDLDGVVLAFESGDEAGEPEEGVLSVVEDGDNLALGKDKPFTLRIGFTYPESKRGRWTLISKMDPGDARRGWSVALDGQGISTELIQEWPVKALQMVANRGYASGAKREVFITYDGSGKAEGIMTFQGGKPLGSRFNMIRANTLDAEGDFDSGGPLRVALPGTFAKEPGVGVTTLHVYDRQLSDAEILALSKEGSVPGLLAKAIGHLEKMEKKAGARGEPTEAGEPEPEDEAKNAKETKNAKKPAELPGKETLLAYYLLKNSEPYRKTMLQRAAAGTALDKVLSRTTTTLVMQEKPDGVPMAHILERGEYDKPGEEVSPGVPKVLPELPEDAPPNRLGLARWLVDPAHPLTARVAVNRMWQELFGTGIVKTSEDFGTQGEPPSHPELLDWLAAEFMESGWDVKALYKTMMLSATYRQSSRLTPPLRKRDPENRLLARGPRFRFDAETIRDQALFVSGLLVDRVGGPSVKPYQPAGLWKTVGYSGSNTVEFHQDHGEAERRRSLYTFWKRTSHPPNMAAFDAPNRESCTVRRERTNTPLQALVLMNDPHFVEASRALAKRVVAELDERNAPHSIDWMAWLVLARPLEADEREILLESLDHFEKAYRADPDAARALAGVDGEDAVRLASWTMLANQVLNLDETINKN